MARIILLITVLVMLGGVVGCKNHSGSREYVPGEGWKKI
jgi:hypothetical protein